MLDVVVLARAVHAADYRRRIGGGGYRPSFWLLAFSMFLFLSLALVKRYAELWTAARSRAISTPAGGATR